MEEEDVDYICAQAKGEHTSRPVLLFDFKGQIGVSSCRRVELTRVMS